MLASDCQAPCGYAVWGDPSPVGARSPGYGPHEMGSIAAGLWPDKVSGPSDGRCKQRGAWLPLPYFLSSESEESGRFSFPIPALSRDP